MIVFVISCMFCLTLFLSTLIIHSPLMRSSPKVVQSQFFTRLRVLKKCSTVQVREGKVKAISNVSLTAFFSCFVCFISYSRSWLLYWRTAVHIRTSGVLNSDLLIFLNLLWGCETGLLGMENQLAEFGY